MKLLDATSNYDGWPRKREVTNLLMIVVSEPWLSVTNFRQMIPDLKERIMRKASNAGLCLTDCHIHILLKLLKSH